MTTKDNDAGQGGQQFSSQVLQKDAVKRVNVQVPDDLHTRAKVIAVLKDITLNQYLEQAIQEAVERDKAVLGRMKQ